MKNPNQGWGSRFSKSLPERLSQLRLPATAYRPPPLQRRPADLQRAATLASSDAQAQGVELDETGGIGLVVGAGIVLEGGDVGVEQGVVGLAPSNDDVALVQLQA